MENVRSDSTGYSPPNIWFDECCKQKLGNQIKSLRWLAHDQNFKTSLDGWTIYKQWSFIGITAYCLISDKGRIG